MAVKKWKSRMELIGTILVVGVILILGICGHANIHAEEKSEITADVTNITETTYRSSSAPEGYEEGEFFGILDIPELSLDLPLYCADVSGLGMSAQRITDEENAGAYFHFGRQRIIADHDYQGFDKIQAVKPGAMATISNPEGDEETFRCVTTAEGYNLAEIYIKLDTVQGDGFQETFQEEVVNLFDLQEDFLIMYTCNGSARDIYITFWKP